MRVVAKLIYPTPCPFHISGVLVRCISVASEIVLFVCVSWVLLYGRCVPFCQIIIVYLISWCVAFPFWHCFYVVLICSVVGAWCFCLFSGVLQCSNCCCCVMAKTWLGRCSQGNPFDLFIVFGQGGSGIQGTYWRSRRHETCPAAHDHD